MIVKPIKILSNFHLRSIQNRYCQNGSSGFFVFNNEFLHFKILFKFIVYMTVFIYSNMVFGHRPHDDIQHFSVVIQEDKVTGLAIVRNNVLRSEDLKKPWYRVSEGLTNRYGFNSLLASKNKSGSVYASASYDGVYRSDDGGISWRTINHGLSDFHVELLAIGGSGQDVIIASSQNGNLWRYSSDNDHWEYLAELSSNITSAKFISTSTVLIGTANGELYQSDLDSANMRKIWHNKDAGSISDIEIAPMLAIDHTIYFGTTNLGVWRSVDDGATFEISLDNDEGSNVTDIAISPNYTNDSTVFVTTWSHAYLSNDGGKSWVNTQDGLKKSSQAESERYFSPHFRSVEIVSYNNNRDYQVVIGGYSGLFLSSDRGQTWSETETFPANLIMSFDISEPDSAGRHSIAVGTYGAGIAISMDEGKSWKFANDGLPDKRVRDIQFSKGYQKNKLVLATIKGALLYSFAPLFEWKLMDLRPKGFFSFMLSFIRPLLEKLMRASETFSSLMNEYAPRPSTKLTIHPTMMSVGSSGCVWIGTSLSGLYYTSESKLNEYIRPNAGFKSTIDEMVEIGDMALSSDCENDESLYVSTAKFAEPPDPSNKPKLYLTEDGGSSFHQISINEKSKGRMRLAISPNFKVDRTILSGSDTGLLYSRDGGQKWERVRSPDDVSQGVISELAISPNFADDSIVVASIKGRGVYISTDAGEAFKAIISKSGELLHGLSHFYSFPATSHAIKFSPNFSKNKTIFGTNGHQILRSTDRGKSWETLRLPNFGSKHH